ncbi:glycoside hydrolase family 26 protein [Gordonia amicalis]|uniref:glycoside hydrolase family 26 protein n=1 Tax=Gordonia amicalis TaxID=89053 RepID=UPI0024B96961|nr:glycosyl hydrolase [Gordonia amicalis]MDJ0455353.1 glycosyl hydrolase [Gordonia amicalis]MDV7078811.1 glycosyl hydrolase [Gordonia amicalis]
MHAARSARPSRSLTRRNFLTVSAGTAAAALLGACSSDQGSPSSVLPQSLWGCFLPVTGLGNPGSATAIDQLARLAGAKPDVVHLYASINDHLPCASLDVIRGTAVTPLITLEPWNPRGGQNQLEFALRSITSGQHDAALHRWASQLAEWKHPVLLRFAQEMNGSWYPWSIGINGNSAAEYRLAWERMHAIISDAATNVSFVWAPNAITEGTTAFTSCYPGDQFVDYLGLDGYNWGTSPGHQWQSANKLFSHSIATLGNLAPDLPILVTEVGCAEGDRPDLKANWIREFYSVIESNHRVSGFVWFQMDKERDWRFNSSPASTAAFRESLGQWTRQ